MVQPSQDAPTASLTVKATKGLSGVAVAVLLKELRELAAWTPVGTRLLQIARKIETGGYDGTGS